MTWYNLNEKAFLYEGDLALLGLDKDQDLPSDIVPLTFTEPPTSANPLVSHAMGEPIQVGDKWQTSWVEVVRTQEELDEIRAVQEKQVAATLEYLTPKLTNN